MHAQRSKVHFNLAEAHGTHALACASSAPKPPPPTCVGIQYMLAESIGMHVYVSINKHHSYFMKYRTQFPHKWPLHCTHTAVCTILVLCCLILPMTPAMSTTFSFLTCSRTWSMVMNVPVRPTPALREGERDSRQCMCAYVCVCVCNLQ